MKKILFTTLVLVAINNMLSAQVSVKFGVEAGTTTSLIRSIDNSATANDQKSTYTAGGGFHLGGVAHINAEKGFSFQTGLRYVAISAKEKIDFLLTPGTNLNGTVKMNFVEIPLNLVFRPTTSKCKCVNKMYGYFGPQIGIAMSGNINYTVTGQPEVDEKLEFGKDADQYKRLQVSFVAGLGYQLSKSMNIQAGYQLGMNDIDNTSDYVTKFGSLKIGLQYYFK